LDAPSKTPPGALEREPFGEEVLVATRRRRDRRREVLTRYREGPHGLRSGRALECVKGERKIASLFLFLLSLSLSLSLSLLNAPSKRKREHGLRSS